MIEHIRNANVAAGHAARAARPAARSSTDAPGATRPATTSSRPASQSLEMAFRMQIEAQEAFDVGTRAAEDPRAVTARATSPTPAWSAGGWSSAACAWCRSTTATASRGTTTANIEKGHRAKAKDTRPADRRAAPRPEGARPARRHAGHLGRRVRPHADERGAERPRPQQPRLHRLAGRRRRQGRHWPTARPTSSASRRSRRRSTSTTCTPRSCT